MRFVDTNAPLYAVSTQALEAEKAARAQATLLSRDLVLSVQVLQEFYVQATRKNRPAPLTHMEAAAFIRSWRRFPAEEITLAILDDALLLKDRYQLSYSDSAIIAAARAANCTEVLSEDMNEGQEYGGIKVVNPFRA